MALRDSRRQRGRLLLFVASIVIGIAALVAINSFGENLQADIDREAKTLLGADVRLDNNFALPDSLETLVESWSTARSTQLSFVSMIQFPKNGGTRLAQIRAAEGEYPYYGKLVTTPAAAAAGYQAEQGVLIEKTLALQYDAAPGDSLRVGALTFRIAGILESAPGRTGIAATAAPAVYLPLRYLDATGLVQPGSRVEYAYYLQLPPGTDAEALLELDGEVLEAAGWDYETVEGRKESLGAAFGDLNAFLNLVAFVALLLGCIGVASAVSVYIREKLGTIAVLRCLGASGRQAFLIYLIQVAALGLFGGLLGAALGSLLQLVIPVVLRDFLPLQNVSTSLSWSAAAAGILTGLAITVLFALLPLLRIRRVSPLRAIRASFEEKTPPADPLRWVVYALIVIFIVGFTAFQAGWQAALFFPLAVTIAVGLLALTARLLTWAVRRFFPRSWSFSARQAVANLYRPNNQTLLLLTTIGLGTALIATLFFTQDLLLQQIQFAGSGDQPNAILFDIQRPQKAGVRGLLNDRDLPIIADVPIVTMRLGSINGETKLSDTLVDRSDWVYDREYRVTYRDSLIDTETIVEGEWHGRVADDGTVYVSLAQRVVRGMRAELGDTLVFDVQGTPLTTVVGSIREVDWNRIQTNFLVVFPEGVLEYAPQFFVLLTNLADEQVSAEFQRALVGKYPNVSIVDLTQILRAVDDVLGKVSFVIQFMAFFSILTGLLVLISSVVLSKYQRIREGVLLRTIGADRATILKVNGLEYALLGMLAALTGILLALLGTWLLARFQFDVPYTPRLGPPLVVLAGIVFLTVLIGLFNTRSVLREPPLRVLRREV